MVAAPRLWLSRTDTARSGTSPAPVASWPRGVASAAARGGGAVLHQASEIVLSIPPVPDSAIQRSTSARRCEFGSVLVVRTAEMAVPAASFAAFAVSRSTECGSPRRTRITRRRCLRGCAGLIRPTR